MKQQHDKMELDFISSSLWINILSTDKFLQRSKRPLEELVETLCAFCWRLSKAESILSACYTLCSKQGRIHQVSTHITECLPAEVSTMVANRKRGGGGNRTLASATGNLAVVR